MSYTFDGPNKRIVLNPGVTTLVLADLWSRWKEWVLAGNAQFLQALDTVGGDIAAIPLYLFPKNGWKIVPQAADHTLTVTGGVLATDDASDPFVDPAGSHAIRIVREAPGIAIGYASDGSTGPSAGEIAAAVWSAFSRTLTSGGLTLEEIEASQVLAKEASVQLAIQQAKLAAALSA